MRERFRYSSHSVPPTVDGLRRWLRRVLVRCRCRLPGRPLPATRLPRVGLTGVNVSRCMPWWRHFIVL